MGKSLRTALRQEPSKWGPANQSACQYYSHQTSQICVASLSGAWKKTTGADAPPTSCPEKVLQPGNPGVKVSTTCPRK